jgi:hypothetical protein
MGNYGFHGVNESDGVSWVSGAKVMIILKKVTSLFGFLYKVL